MSTTSSTARLIHYNGRPTKRNQVLASLVISLGPFAAGMGKGYSSPALASLETSVLPDGLRVTPQEASWILAISLLGALVGDVVGGVAMNQGRKRLLQCSSLPFALVWLLTVFANHVAMILVSSFIGGVCSAVILLTSHIYVSEDCPPLKPSSIIPPSFLPEDCPPLKPSSIIPPSFLPEDCPPLKPSSIPPPSFLPEIASPEIRGRLCSLSKITSNLGMLTCYILGYFMGWRQLALVSAAFPLILFMLVMWLPETPSFLLFRGDEEDAEESLQWLRGEEAFVQGELEELKISVSVNRRFKPRSFTDIFWDQTLRRSTLITCSLVFFQKFTGAFVLNSDAVRVFSKTFFLLDAHLVAIVHASLQLASSLACGLFIDRLGRVPLLKTGMLVVSLALFLLGSHIYFTVDRDSPAKTSSEILPLVCVIVFTVAYSGSIGPLTSLLISELFPLEFRGRGGALATGIGHACGFIVVKTFLDFELLLCLSGTFWTYAAISLGGAIFVSVAVPETKGRSLDDIQRDMEKSTW
ncbi:unnamed protein product [Cyprideis torosa]|uniref:Uncharacterized protein n=1 Tax=Cyprideis torosa TaxID=163714 RepID=A0A7R8WAY3_9CRUS|nr:unnamed protein product [Cyprideis torosa]CAG0886804.1 unnamed protein product [Cyprideis torosa]